MSFLKLKNFFVVSFMMLAFVFFSPPTLAQTQNWQHPGVLVSQAQLDFIKQQVNAHVQPFYQEFLKAQASEYGSKTYTPKGPYPGGVTQCGSYSSPDNGCSNEDSDSAAAYVQSLLWYITGDQTYATNAIKILNAYGHGLKGFAGFTPGYPCPGAAKTCSNGPLQAAWDATKWPRAAEIIRYANGGSAGWAAADITAFTNMLTNIYEPIIYNGSPNNGNWELSMIEGMMGIAVFNEDLALLQHAQLFWGQRVPAYFYNYVLDDPLYPNSHAPFPPGRSLGGTTWNGQLIFAADTTGVSQETCRDLKHTEYGIASAINAAETDYIQGGDLTANLYTANGAQERLVTSLNLMAGLESKASTAAPQDFCTKAGDKITLGIGTTYVIGYNEYHNRLKDPNMADGSGSTGLNGTSNTYNWIQNGLLPQKLASDGGAHMTIFEPLTHYANVATTPSFSLSLAPLSQTVAAGSSASYTVTVSPLAGYLGTVSLSLSQGLPAGATASFKPASISGGSGTSALTVTTSSLTPAASYTLVAAGADGTVTNSASATMVVTPPASTVTITANNQTMIEGGTPPALTYTVNPNVALTTNPSCVTTVTSKSTPGDYPITCSGAVKDGYTFNYLAGTFTVTPSVTAVTITARDHHMKPGENVPALTYKVHPSSAILTKDPSCTTTATSSSPLGEYPINCAGAEGLGYVFTYVPGTLTIKK